MNLIEVQLWIGVKYKIIIISILLIFVNYLGIEIYQNIFSPLVFILFDFMSNYESKKIKRGVSCRDPLEENLKIGDFVTFPLNTQTTTGVYLFLLVNIVDNNEYG